MYLSIYLNAVTFPWMSHLFHIVFLYLTHCEQLAKVTKLDSGPGVKFSFMKDITSDFIGFSLLTN